MVKRESICLTLVLFSLPFAAFPATFYVSPSGGHSYPYDSWTTAATNIAVVFDYATDGDRVCVTNGTYALSEQISITNAITLESVNGPAQTVLDAGGNCRCVLLSHPESRLEGFTLTNGFLLNRAGFAQQMGAGVHCEAGLVRDCVIVGNRVLSEEPFSVPAFAGGFHCGSGGELHSCVVAHNWSQGYVGGGTCAGLLENCRIEDNHSEEIGGIALVTAGIARSCRIERNTATNYCGGVSLSDGALLQNSLVADNAAPSAAGVVFVHGESTLRNSTIVNNSANSCGGLLVGDLCTQAAVVNCIVADNAGGNVSNAVPVAVYSYSCSFPLLPGIGNIADAPQFVDASSGDYHLTALSPCIDAGTTNAMPDRDLDGTPRPLDGDADGIATVDIGAYEYDIPRTDTHYVSLHGGHVYPYTNWPDAATNIQDAVDAAAGGATVLIVGGTYALQTQVTVGTNILVEAVNGAASTRIDGRHTTRCFRLLPDAGCVVRGFSITNGVVATNEYGGGVWIGSGNVLADCVIAGCAAGSGAGVYATDAVISNCTFLGNTAEWAGGGLVVSPNGRGFLVDGCTFTANTADTGGGAFCGSLSNSVEAVQGLMASATDFLDSLAGLDNVAQNLTNILSDLATGPGPLPPPDMSASPGRPEMMRVPCDVNATSNVIRGCSATGNTALCGGGFFLLDCLDTVVSNCTLTGNEAECGGGLSAANGGVMCESTVSDNHAYLLGGGILAWEGTEILNCHVNSNSAVNAAGGCWLAFSGVSVLAGGGTTHEMTGGGPAALRVAGSEFVGNDGGMLGGGLFLGDGIAVSNTFFQNSARWGGGVANLGGSVSASVVVENSADVGGGILNGGAVSSCVLCYNSADIGGGVASVPFFTGGIAVWPSPPGDSPVADCDVLQNVALGGGGVALLDAGPLTACTVASNSAGMAGGGVLTILRSEIHSSLVHGNSAGDGAGIYCLNGGDTIQCTVTANDAAYSGGGLFVVTNETGFGGQYETDVFVGNSIVHGNSASNAPNFLNLASNVVYSYTCTFPAIPGTGNITNSPLFTNATARDYHLQPSSPCIDAGSNGLMPPGTDLDGLSRPLDGDNDGTATVDMGCYEHLNRAADSDGDTMPDGWEFDHGLNLVADDSGQDADNDTLNNGGEYAADTDPQDGNSVLSVIGIDEQLGGIRVDWKGGREAWQILECRSHLTSTTEQWTAIFGVPPPTPLTNAIIDLGATNRTLFYRIRAER